MMMSMVMEPTHLVPGVLKLMLGLETFQGFLVLTRQFGLLQTTYQTNMLKVVSLVFLKAVGVLLLLVLRCS